MMGIIENPKFIVLRPDFGAKNKFTKIRTKLSRFIKTQKNIYYL